ncbi:hypothetical protein B0H11DRAFT_1164532 [Mycena galericulata]|nr:hypothetical protein B0H11DRAFT_1164532 [Mycena galericulata]
MLQLFRYISEENVAQCLRFRLELSCRTYSTEIRPRFKAVTRHVLSSLRPEKIKSSDFIDLAGGRKLTVHFYKEDPPFRLCYASSMDGMIPFPPHACGYSYYVHPRECTLFAGAIRLRVHSDDALGSDLLLPNGLPWQIVLPQIVTYQRCAGSLRKLLEDQLITKTTVEECWKVFSGRRVLNPGTLIFHLEQPFALAMDQGELRLTIVGREKLGIFLHQKLFNDSGYAFGGAILARFELSPARDYVSIRVVKIVSKVILHLRARGYTGRVIAPKEGELLSFKFRGVPRPWSLSLAPNSSSSADALRLLFDS